MTDQESLKVGDRVEITGDRREFLNGKHGKITRINGDNAEVQIEEKIGRTNRAGISLKNLKKVEGTNIESRGSAEFESASSLEFEVEITRWAAETSGRKLPVCKLTSSAIIRNAGFDFDAYSGESINVHHLSGRYIASFIFWSEARVHAVIGDITMIMVNLDDRVGIFLYSRTKSFTVNNVNAVNKSGVWHSFAVLEASEKLQVKIGDRA